MSKQGMGLALAALLASSPALAQDPKAAADAARQAAKEAAKEAAREKAKEEAKDKAEDAAGKKAPDAPPPAAAADDGDKGGIGQAGDARAQEDAHHAMRMAKIARIEEIGKGDATKKDLVAKAEKLRGLEMRRHEKALRRIEKGLGKKEGLGKEGGKGQDAADDKGKDKDKDKGDKGKGKGKDKDKGGEK